MVYIRIPVRKEVMNRAQNKCEMCGATQNLEIHHIVTWRNGGTHDASNLQLLCESCHTEKKILHRVYHGSLVSVNETFTAEEYSALARIKGKTSWHDFIMKLTKLDTKIEVS